MNVTHRPIKLWPEGWRERTEYVRSPFDATYTQTIKLLDRETWMLGADDVLVQLDVRERSVTRDGSLRADAKVHSPGVIVSFTARAHGDLVYATDRFSHWHANLRAIALGLESLRRVERYGIADRGQQYAGYRELGSGIALGPTTLTPDVAAKLIADALDVALDMGVSGDDVLRSWPTERLGFWRSIALAHHPDHGGDHAVFAQLVAARGVLDEALSS